MALRQPGGDAMEQPRDLRFTAEAFIAWAIDEPGRYELVDGVVYAMASERVAHARAKAEVYMSLRAGIAARGLGCEALIDGVAVKIDDASVFEPDALVRCGPAAPGDAVIVDDPVIVVEVVSPSSRAIDTGMKLAGYFRVPSVRHYLIVDTAGRLVIHYRRDEEGAIAVRIVGEGVLALDPPGIEIAVADIFPRS